MPFPYLPKPLYEALPVLYVSGGMFVALWSESGVGLFSGLLLAAAGVRIRFMRRSHRMQVAAYQATLDARLDRQWKRRVG